MFSLSNKYSQMQNATDSPIQLSTRAVRSILLYCQDWDDKSLPLSQRLQSVQAGQVLCDAMVQSMIDDLPEREASLLMTIFIRATEFDRAKTAEYLKPGALAPGYRRVKSCSSVV